MRQGEGLRDVGELPGPASGEVCTVERQQVAGWTHGAGSSSYRMDVQP